jgi:O-succinylbenzoic acid--CoA ligase
VTIRAHRDAAPGELVAIDLPPGEPWLDALADLWWRGVAVLPIDHRLSPAEKRAIVDAAAPSLLIDDGGATAFPDVGVTDPDGSAVVIATSGTGGRPKLAELSRRALEGAIERSNAAIEETVDTPWLAVLTPAHVGGLLVYLRHAIFNTPVAAHERFDPEALTTGGSVCASIVPAMAAQLADAGDASLDAVTLVIGGGPLDRDVRSALQLRGARVFQTYGMTETCGGIAYEGSPMPDVEVRIAPGDRVEVRSPTLFSGYRRDPRSTADAFNVDGWLRTGDLGSLDEDGRLTVYGRADDAIRTGGETVWPEEVEQALREHPKVTDAAVRGVPDARWGEQVAAWVVPRTIDDPPTLEELRDHCATTLARFKLPKELSLVAELPKTATGKVRRAELR